jgi:hypothetical protein
VSITRPGTSINSARGGGENEEKGCVLREVSK